MRFSLTFVAAALVSFVLAKDNAFSIPAAGNYIGLKAGGSQTFTWTNLAGTTVTLMLRSGSNGDLSSGTVIADHIKNTGSYTWSIPTTQVEGADYAIEIINDDNTAESEDNFTPQFVISSPIKAVPTSASASGVTVTTMTSVSGTATAAATLTVSTGASNGTVSSGSATKTHSPTKSSTSTSSSSTASVSVPATNAANGLKAGGAILALAAGVAILL